MKKQTISVFARGSRVLLLFIVLFVLVVLFLFRTAQSSFGGGSETSPYDITLSQQLVAENSANGTAIGTLSALDPDTEAANLVFILVNDAENRFSIGANNMLQVENGNQFLDYEAAPFYGIKVLVRDPEWNTYEEEFTIILNNRNEAPTDIVFQDTPVNEGATVGTVVGALVADDPDQGDSHTFQLLSNGGGRFQLANGNQVVVATGAQLTSSSYDIQVRVTDAVQNSYEKYLSVTVNPAQAPVASSLALTSANPESTTLSWSTNKNAKSRVEYGVDTNFGSMTQYTSTFTANQVVELPVLADCTTYDYRIRSIDTLGKEMVGATQTLTTAGCPGGAPVVMQHRDNVPVSSGGNVELKDNQGMGLRLMVPAAFTNAETIQFQMKKLDVGSVLTVAGLPQEGLANAGGHIYDLKALNDDFAVTQFGKSLLVSLSYSDSDIAVVDESSLRLYRWDGESWKTLSQCDTDVLNNTITCATDKFSVFGAFGRFNDTVQILSGKAKTIRAKGMARGDFRGTASEGVNKVSFKEEYEKSLREVARLNEGTQGSAWATTNREGEKVFGGYKSGKLSVARLQPQNVAPQVVYRGGGRAVVAGSSQVAMQSPEVGQSAVSRKLQEIKDKFKKSDGAPAQVAKEDREQRLQVIMDDKLNRAKTLLQIYQIAAEEMALCLNQESAFCDEMYEYLAREIAVREKEVIDSLLEQQKN